MLKITSPEALDAAVADIVRMRIALTQAVAAKERELARIEKERQGPLMAMSESIQQVEEHVRDYCEANRAALFVKVKSRETPLAVIGFELTPPRVETASRRVKWADVLERLARLAWGKAYLRPQPDKIDKEALLQDRDTIPLDQQAAAGIRFAQDEQFFIRPKLETAARA